MSDKTESCADKPFKVCQSCQRVWQTREDLEQDLEFLGVQRTQHLVFYAYNCHCGTSFMIERESDGLSNHHTPRYEKRYFRSVATSTGCKIK